VSDSRQSDATDPIEADPAIGPQPGDVVEARHRYRLERRLGTGGFGSVFLAHPVETSSSTAENPPREVAVKILGPASRVHARTTLKRELGALLSIQHPGIPRLYDWTVDREPAFAALEYFPAGSLADAWPMIGKFEEEQTWRLMSDLLSALGAAHRASILHLDVKPSNVLLDGNGGFVLAQPPGHCIRASTSTDVKTSCATRSPGTSTDFSGSRMYAFTVRLPSKKW
jgi:serine/threonine protein kinase